MQQVKYVGENFGYFGLVFDEYLYFILLICCYFDFVVYCMLKKVFLGDFKVGNCEVVQFQGCLFFMGEYISDCECIVVEVECDFMKYYQCKWVQEYRGEFFMGNVFGVVFSGLYVVFDNGVEGKLYISYFDDDYYIFIEDVQILKGCSNGKSFWFGDVVQVIISDVKLFVCQIDLILVDFEDFDYIFGSYDFFVVVQEIFMIDVKVCVCCCEDCEQEWQEKFKSIFVIQFKFIFDDLQLVIQSSL